jgi:hypothetical protein
MIQHVVVLQIRVGCGPWAKFVDQNAVSRKAGVPSIRLPVLDGIEIRGAAADQFYGQRPGGSG